MSIDRFCTNQKAMTQWTWQSQNLQSRNLDRRLGDPYTSASSRFLSLRNVGGWEGEDGVRIAEAVASVFALHSRSSSELPFGARRLLT